MKNDKRTPQEIEEDIIYNCGRIEERKRILLIIDKQLDKLDMKNDYTGYQLEAITKEFDELKTLLRGKKV